MANNNKPIASIRSRIEEALIICNMKPIDLSNATGIPKSSISHYLNGKVNPKQDRIYLMAKAFNCDPSWLMGYDTDFKKKTEFDFEINSAWFLSDIAFDLKAQKLVELFKQLDEDKKEIVLDMMEMWINKNHSD